PGGVANLSLRLQVGTTTEHATNIVHVVVPRGIGRSLTLLLLATLVLVAELRVVVPELDVSLVTHRVFTGLLHHPAENPVIVVPVLQNEVTPLDRHHALIDPGLRICLDSLSDHLPDCRIAE